MKPEGQQPPRGSDALDDELASGEFHPEKMNPAKKDSKADRFKISQSDPSFSDTVRPLGDVRFVKGKTNI